MNKNIIYSGHRLVRDFAIATVFALVGVLSVSAQNAVRISEVQTRNVSGLMDESGNRSAWIEFNNVTAATTNVAGMFLTDDPNEPTKYPIRSGSVKTSVAPHQTFVLFLDGKADKGVFHSGLTLDPTKENTIYLYEGDGVNLVDQVTVPVMEADQSYAYIITDESANKGRFEVVNDATPDELNTYVHGNQNVENFKSQDPIGLVMTLIAMGVVFSGLVLLYFVFGSIGKRFNKRDEKAQNAAGSPVAKKAAPSPASSIAAGSGKGTPTPEGMQAAIAMALHDYQNSGLQAAIALALYETRTRNEQTGMINLRRDPSTSAWANKSLTLRRLPNF
ncbi:MAG: OadG family protein [Bacteroidales bacterium]|nr:OadG family protein [Bacteroidales bacterium]